MKYQKWHIGTASEQDTALLKEAGYPSLLATVLAARGITTSEAAAEALERETSLTISPMLMRDMDKAVARIQKALANVCKNLPQTGVQKFPIGGLLDLQQVGHGHDFLVPGKILSEGFAVVLVLSHLHFHLSFAPPPCPAAGQVLYPIRSGELLNLFQFPIAFRWRMCYPVFVIRMGFHPLPFI